MSICSFKDWDRTQPVPFRIYADFEALLPDVQTSQQNSKTEKLQQHVPDGYSFVVVDHEGNKYDARYFRATDSTQNVSKIFLTEIIQVCKNLQVIMKGYQNEAEKTMTFGTNNTAQKPTAQSTCFFCGEGFSQPSRANSERSLVRHHSHLPPYAFVGYAHNQCNLNAKMRNTIPVIIHNFGSYDCHFIVQALNKDIVDSAEIIPKTSENFLSIIVNDNIRFLDSYAFFSESLGSLAASLPKDSFRITRQVFGYHDEYAELEEIGQHPENIDAILRKYKKSFVGDVNLLLQKQAYPYSYIKSLDVFRETELPPPEAFHNDLSDQPIEPSVYQHQKKIWENFNLVDMGDYHDLYVLADSCILADIFEANRRTMLKHYGLDLAHYFSMPMISKDALLKKTGVKLELLTDSTMYIWLEKGIRGGLVSVGSLRCAKANNPYMGNEYSPEESTSYITVQDANNLYGWALCEPLPHKDFEWESEDFVATVTEQFIKSLTDEEEKGYIFEVDLDVPPELHDYLNVYPPAPVKRVVNREQLSVFQQTLMDKFLYPFESTVDTINKTHLND